MRIVCTCCKGYTLSFCLVQHLFIYLNLFTINLMPEKTKYLIIQNSPNLLVEYKQAIFTQVDPNLQLCIILNSKKWYKNKQKRLGLRGGVDG